LFIGADSGVLLGVAVVATSGVRSSGDYLFLLAVARA
jgi:hypothetical protein